MSLKVTETALPGVLIIEPAVHGDQRGFFMESWREDQYRELGIKETFVQDNHSRSTGRVLRGLHGQKKYPQGKLVRVVRGAVYDVTVDVNPDSPTYKQYVGVELTEENHKLFYVPPGYFHGFCVLSDTVDFLYKCTDYYHPDDEIGVRWDDPELAIEWPVESPMLSQRDLALPFLKDLKLD